MKWLWTLFLSLFCLGAAAQNSLSVPEVPLPGPAVSVRGTVVDSLTGKPLDAVHVTLTLQSAQPSIVYGAMSDAQGRFSIPDIPVGEYAAWAEKRGFIFVPERKKSTVWYGSLLLSLKAGERPADLVLPMVMRAIITGRVLDEHGDPLHNAEITAISVNRETGGLGYTNGRGEFRLSVPPGKYYVEGSRWSDSDSTEEPWGAHSESGYLHTYYPGVTRMGGASVVEAFAGRVVNGMEFRLVRAHSFRVSGEITGLPGGDGLLTLWWRLADSDLFSQTGRETGRLDFNTQQAASAGSSIKFYSPPLDSGTYHFYAVCCVDENKADEHKEELRSQIAEVTLSDSDVTGITLTLAPASEITGTISMIGGPVVPPGKKISVILTPEIAPSFFRGLEGKIGANGAFKIGNVLPNRYRFEVGPLLEEAYIRSVELNGSAVRGNLLDFFEGAAGAKLKIVVSAGGARITGQVRKSKNDAPAGGAIVLLFPEHDGLGVDKEECQAATADAGGIYHFQHLAPGRYRFLVRTTYSRDECELAVTAIRQGLTAGSIELKAGKTVKDLRIVDEASDESRW